MRLPPPPRRYSPISVMAPTFETVSRPNSRSMAERSSRRRSNISFAFIAGGLARRSFIVGPALIRSVVRELHVDTEIAALHQRDDLLQRVAVFAGHPHGVALDRGLHLFLGILDCFHDLLRLFDWDTLLHRDLLPHGRAKRRVHRAVAQRFEWHAALHHLLLENVVD